LNLKDDGAEFQTVKILSKYALREHLGPLVFALTALTSLLLLNYIAKNIGQLVGKGLPWSVIGEFVGLSVPFTFAMTLPMAVLVSVLYAFSRLASENEITALRASGVSLARLLVPAFCGAAALSVFMVAFNDQILPRANHRLRTLMEDIARKKPTFALHAQVINEVSPGKLYLRAGQLDESSDRMREVVIYDLGDPSRRRTIFADSGTMALTASGDLVLTLYHGSMQDIQKASPAELQRIYYMVNHVRVRGVGNSLTRSTNDTYKSEREMSVCEMQGVVSDAERADAETREEVRHDLVNAVRVATTGTSLSPPNPPGSPGNPFRAGLGVGRAYCDAVAALSRLVPAPRPRPPAGPNAAPGAASAPATSPSAAAQPSAVPSAGVPSAGVPSAGVPSAGVPSAGVPSAGLPPSAGVPSAGMGGVPNDGRVATQVNAAGGPVPLPRPRTLTQVLPGVAVVTLNTVTASLDAAHARIEDNRRTNSTYDVEIQKKFAISVACAIFVLLGAPIALRFPRGGVGLVIGVSFAVFGLYYVGLIAGEPLAQNGTVSPFWAMWASNVIFFVVGVILLARVGRAGSTARGNDLGEIKDAFRERWIQFRAGGVPRHAAAPEHAA
jgi:lipopolysaccharide export system permease protein